MLVVSQLHLVRSCLWHRRGFTFGLHMHRGPPASIEDVSKHVGSCVKI